MLALSGRALLENRVWTRTASGGVGGELAVDDPAPIARRAVGAALQEAVAVRDPPAVDREAVQHRQPVEPVAHALTTAVGGGAPTSNLAGPVRGSGAAQPARQVAGQRQLVHHHLVLSVEKPRVGCRRDRVDGHYHSSCIVRTVRYVPSTLVWRPCQVRGSPRPPTSCSGCSSSSNPPLRTTSSGWRRRARSTSGRCPTQLYTECARLAQEGLLRSAQARRAAPADLPPHQSGRGRLDAWRSGRPASSGRSATSARSSCSSAATRPGSPPSSGGSPQPAARLQAAARRGRRLAARLEAGAGGRDRPRAGVHPLLGAGGSGRAVRAPLTTAAASARG
jgi:hypothetical protein